MEIKKADFYKKVRALELRRNKMEKRLLDAVSSYYDMQIMSIPSTIINKPIYLLDEKDLAFLKKEDQNTDSKVLKEAKNAGASNQFSPPKFRKPSTRSSRTDKFKTPARAMKTPMSAMVTPKFNPLSTMSVMRKPKEGEIAMSMSGSPLHVTSVINQSKPNVVVPLQDGKILSVLPERGIRRSEIPDIDPDLRRQLKVLKENLTAILSMDE